MAASDFESLRPYLERLTAETAAVLPPLPASFGRKPYLRYQTDYGLSPLYLTMELSPLYGHLRPLVDAFTALTTLPYERGPAWSSIQDLACTLYRHGWQRHDAALISLAEGWVCAGENAGYGPLIRAPGFYQYDAEKLELNQAFLTDIVRVGGTPRDEVAATLTRKLHFERGIALGGSTLWPVGRLVAQLEKLEMYMLTIPGML